MVTWNVNFSKVRQGMAKCTECGGFYDPTYGPCSCKHKRYFINFFAAIIIVFLAVMCTVDAGAHQPEPTPECFIVDGKEVCISHIALTPFVPTATPIPAPTVAPTVTPTPTIVMQPHPTATPQAGHSVYLSLILR